MSSSVSVSTASSAESLLRRIYGYSSFRGQQGAIVETVANGRDALVLMPTGGGKSLCYQLPALIRDGVGVVISPLIALMEDQVQALRQVGVQAAYLNSTLQPQEAKQVYRELRSQKLDLLYLAPERLLKPDTLEFLSSLRVSLIAIDEAHCVSMWGHDFRPEYLQLRKLGELFPNVPRIALTATADHRTRADIKESLGLEAAEEFVSSFDRPNIFYKVAPKQDVRKQFLQFYQAEWEGESGIVYCLSRKKVEETAAWLTQQNVSALPYHAGLSEKVRQANQRRFLDNEGVVMVATIAFGMGINKPNVRFVAHFDLPKNIEAYYQETGRAGRDGLPATAWLAYGMSDLVILRQLIENGESSLQRKRVEHQKLNALLAYVESTVCRRRLLLQYFGEEYQGSCGTCDACTEPLETWDGTLHARQALSCVYRTGQRFGAAYLTDVLLGRDTPRIKNFGHDSLSVFGIGKDLHEKEWASVFRQLLALGHLSVDTEGFGVLLLTPQSRDLLRGEGRISFRKDRAVSKKKRGVLKKKPAAGSVANDSLFSLLRERRLMLAKELSVPPYIIFHDRTLLEIAERMPESIEAFATISGVGEAKLARYAPAMLEVVKMWRMQRQ